MWGCMKDLHIRLKKKLRVQYAKSGENKDKYRENEKFPKTVFPDHIGTT